MERSAGILLHVSSLPGNSPIGNFGKEAFEFIDFLADSGQQIWQILPLNQTDGGKNHSPYSPLSAFAGNILFIDYTTLSSGLKKDIIKTKNYKSNSLVDYYTAELIQEKVLHIVYKHFKKSAKPQELEQFEQFCSDEHYWLNDYALFIVLKNSFKKKSWDNWPKEFRDRHQDSIDKILHSEYDAIRQEKYFQFLFMQQWLKLKQYANDKGIRIFGDVPIYTSYDSSDVWAHPHFFMLKENKKMDKVAGVPPDYFNEDGQLWNMPIYNWENLKHQSYDWWIQRLRKNLQLYDLVRLDHFRGFSAYWEVEANSKNAKKGKWISAPAYDFFNTVRHHFPHMPFAAEDLGDIDQAVYDLRDHFQMPGMRVIQFAFGDDFPNSIHIPHRHTENSIAYSGTHDNNTGRGWYCNELSKKQKKHVKDYFTYRSTKNNIHRQLIRQVYLSTAKIAIIPMQDILGLGSKARMNLPSSIKGNWLWRLKKGQVKKSSAKWISKLVSTYGRLK